LERSAECFTVPMRGDDGQMTMKAQKPRQLELFADGARAVAAAGSKPHPLTEERLQAKLDGARQRVREIVILRMKSWLPEETWHGLREAEAFRREQVRVHHRVLERFREQQRRPLSGANPPPSLSGR
jgi:hypothetical protein